MPMLGKYIFGSPVPDLSRLARDANWNSMKKSLSN
jgi:hypothetical protein